MSAKKSGKYQRTTQEQLHCYVQFCKENPELQVGKNSPKAPQGIKNLWDKLSENLNALRGPTRTAAEWKTSLSHWKNQLRCRARKIKASKKMTGGGPPIEDLNEFEQQAVYTFGNIAVDGCLSVATLGCKEEGEETQNMTLDEVVETSSSTILNEKSDSSRPSNIVEGLVSTTLMDSIPYSEKKDVLPPSQTKPHTIEDVLNLTRNSIKEREAYQSQLVDIAKSFLEQSVEITNSIQQLTQAVNKLSNKLDEIKK